MILEIKLPDNAENIRVFYDYKGKDGEAVYAVKEIEGVKFKAVPAKELDLMWRKDYAKKQEQEKEAHNQFPETGTEIQPEC